MNSSTDPPPTEKKTRVRFSLSRITRNLLTVIVLSLIGLFAISMTSKQPDNLGVSAGQLAACPDTPNCVSTQAADPVKRMDPIAFSGTPSEAISKIKQAIKLNWPRATLISETEYYLHYEFKSLIFRFIDDVEFFVDDKNSVIQFRSASRVGHSDLGVNRKRMNQLVESIKP